MGNKDFQKRVIIERDQLDMKLGLLNTFMHTSEFNSLSNIEFGLLMVQQRAMTAYLDALNLRILSFN